jgi:hypothetical protein
MNKIKIGIILFGALLLMPCNVNGQDRPMVEDLGVGTKKAPEQIAFPDGPLPVEQWVGEEFIFLPQCNSLQKYGYQECIKQGAKSSDGLPYDGTVGRVGKVLEVVPVTRSKFILHLTMTDPDEVFECTGHYFDIGIDNPAPSFDGLALVKDILLAREKYEGNTYYAARREFSTYDSKTGGFGSVKVLKYSPVKVVRVSAGTSSRSPIRLVVETEEGKQGYHEIPFSGTNAPHKPILTFDTYFVKEDPRKKHKWSKRVWEAIGEESVFVGMTEEQTRMSLGDPPSVTESISKGGVLTLWHYRGLMVTIIKGRVDSVVTTSE